MDWHKRYKYGRTVGKVLAKGNDVNLAMVSAGMAWCREYASEQTSADRVIYVAAERKAEPSARSVGRSDADGAVGLAAPAGAGGGLRRGLSVRVGRGLYWAEGRAGLCRARAEEAGHEGALKRDSIVSSDGSRPP